MNKTKDLQATISRLRASLRDLGAIECPCGHWNHSHCICNACGYDRTDPDARPPKRKAVT
jgi:hypothetical protein